MPPPDDFEVIVSSDVSADVVTAAVYRALPLGPVVQCLDDGRKRLERLGFGGTRRSRDKRTIVPPR